MERGIKYAITILLCCLCFNANARLTLGEKKDIKAFVISGSVMGASLCNSAMDEMSDHYHTSLFAKFNNPQFFNHENGYSSDHSPHIAGYPIDGWHFCKSTMVVLICVPVSVVCHENFPIIKKHPVWDMILWEAIAGTAWNLTFNVNYNKLLR